MRTVVIITIIIIIIIIIIINFFKMWKFEKYRYSTFGWLRCNKWQLHSLEV